MDNIHEQTNSVCGKFSANGNHENFFPICENSKNVCHLWINLRELLFYKLLSESSFNLFCLIISLVCVLKSKLLKIASTRMMKSLKFLLLWHTSAAFTLQTRHVPVSKVLLYCEVKGRYCSEELWGKYYQTHLI